MSRPVPSQVAPEPSALPRATARSPTARADGLPGLDIAAEGWSRAQARGGGLVCQSRERPSAGSSGKEIGEDGGRGGGDGGVVGGEGDGLGGRASEGTMALSVAGPGRG